MSRLYVGLDTDFILCVALGAETHLGALDAISKLRAQAIVCPSVMQELQDIADNHEVRAERAHAALALRELTNWGILAPPIEPVDLGLVELFARRLADGDGRCFQSICVLGETAVMRARLLLTEREELLHIDSQHLKLALIERDLPDCLSVPAAIFLEFFNPDAMAAATAAGVAQEAVSMS